MFNEKMEQEKIWDAIASQWSNFRQRPNKDIEGKLRFFSEKWKPGRILDIGCGNCRNLVLFCYNGFKCYGIDFSEKMLDEAEKFCVKHKMKVALKKGYANNLSFPDKSFDYVLCLSVLHNLEKKEREECIHEIKRVLKSNGEALISVWNKFQKRFIFSKKERFIPWRVHGRVYERYYYLFSPREIRNLLVKHGFRVVKYNFFGENIILHVKKERM